MVKFYSKSFKQKSIEVNRKSKEIYEIEGQVSFFKEDSDGIFLVFENKDNWPFLYLKLIDPKNSFAGLYNLLIGYHQKETGEWISVRKLITIDLQNNFKYNIKISSEKIYIEINNIPLGYYFFENKISFPDSFYIKNCQDENSQGTKENTSIMSSVETFIFSEDIEIPSNPKLLDIVHIKTNLSPTIGCELEYMVSKSDLCRVFNGKGFIDHPDFYLVMDVSGLLEFKMKPTLLSDGFYNQIKKFRIKCVEFLNELNIKFSMFSIHFSIWNYSKSEKKIKPLEFCNKNKTYGTSVRKDQELWRKTLYQDKINTWSRIAEFTEDERDTCNDIYHIHEESLKKIHKFYQALPEDFRDTINAYPTRSICLRTQGECRLELLMPCGLGEEKELLLMNLLIEVSKIENYQDITNHLDSDMHYIFSTRGRFAIMVNSNSKDPMTIGFDRNMLGDIVNVD